MCNTVPTTCSGHTQLWNTVIEAFCFHQATTLPSLRLYSTWGLGGVEVVPVWGMPLAVDGQLPIISYKQVTIIRK